MKVASVKLSAAKTALGQIHFSVFPDLKKLFLFKINQESQLSCSSDFMLKIALHRFRASGSIFVSSTVRIGSSGSFFLVDATPLFGGVKVGNFRNNKIGLFHTLI
jgi:hypothetical protein